MIALRQRLDSECETVVTSNFLLLDFFVASTLGFTLIIKLSTILGISKVYRRSVTQSISKVKWVSTPAMADLSRSPTLEVQRASTASMVDLKSITEVEWASATKIMDLKLIVDPPRTKSPRKRTHDLRRCLSRRRNQTENPQDVFEIFRRVSLAILGSCSGGSRWQG